MTRFLERFARYSLHRNDDDEAIQQAVVFIEDSYSFKSIFHKVDPYSISLYNLYFSSVSRWARNVTILVIHLLAFVEYPSSLTVTADVRSPVSKAALLPCGITESIEIICLCILFADCVVKCYLIGWKKFKRLPWLYVYAVVIAIYFLDFVVTISLVCKEHTRIRRLLRPFFLMQNSSMMKKTINGIRRTLPEVASVLTLLFFHIYFFTLAGMLMFTSVHAQNIPTSATLSPNITSVVTPAEANDGDAYFHDLIRSYIQMLVLLTTANNPDVTMQAYNINRFSSVFFVVFLFIGTFCFMSMLTAIIFNQFRGYLKSSLQSSLFRRRLGIRAAYQVLSHHTIQLRRLSLNTSEVDLYDASVGVPSPLVRNVLQRSHIPQHQVSAMLHEMDEFGSTLNSFQFQNMFLELDKPTPALKAPPIHYYSNRGLNFVQRIFSHARYIYVSVLISMANVFCLSILIIFNHDDTVSSVNSYMMKINGLCVLWYILELGLRVMALGWRRYFFYSANRLDLGVTVLMVVFGMWFVVEYGFPFSTRRAMGHKDGLLSLSVLIRLLNILMLLRITKLIPEIKSMWLVTSTMIDMIVNMRAFVGLMCVIFYEFALIGMLLFRDVIPAQNNLEVVCGSYEQLNYWSNNFNDFAASIIILWDVMVVNNWMVFLDAFSRYTSSWSQLYFIVWYILSVVLGMNIFVALILENFVTKWDRFHRLSASSDGDSAPVYEMSIHALFWDNLQEPSEEELLEELSNHEHISVHVSSYLP